MIGIVILNYNNASITIDCVESIENTNTAECKYVVVDNASVDDSIITLDSYFKKKQTVSYQKYNSDFVSPNCLPIISLVSAKNNGGYAQGNNLGCRLMENDESIDYILILNNDTIFIQDILPVMKDFLDEHQEAGVISPLLKESHEGKIKYNSAREEKKIGELFATYAHLECIRRKYIKKQQILLNNPELLLLDFAEIDVPTGACLMLKKELFKEIGYFDPNTFLYFEENILSKKIKSRGLHNYVLPQQKIIHLGQATTKKTKFNLFQERQRASSAYYYGINYCGMNTFLKPLFYILYRFHILFITVKHILK